MGTVVLKPVRDNRRPGFTLVELMVVVAIILILVSVSVGVVFKFLASQKQAATQRTVDQVNAAIERVLKNIRTKGHTDFASFPNKVDLTNTGKSLFNLGLLGLSEPNRMAELIYVDLQIARSFPQNFNFVFKPLPNQTPPQIAPPVFWFPSNLIDVSSDINIQKTITFYPKSNSAIGSNVMKVLNQKFSDLLAMIPTNQAQAVPSIINSSPNKTTGQNLSVEIQNSACLLMALEANPDGLKGENLGSAIMTDAASGARYLATGDGKPIGFHLRYLDSASGGSKSVVGTVTVELIVP